MMTHIMWWSRSWTLPQVAQVENPYKAKVKDQTENPSEQPKANQKHRKKRRNLNLILLKW